ncbi:hypothetical protein D1872_256170 [compost metagenome]
MIQRHESLIQSMIMIGTHNTQHTCIRIVFDCVYDSLKHDIMPTFPSYGMRFWIQPFQPLIFQSGHMVECFRIKWNSTLTGSRKLFVPPMIQFILQPFFFGPGIASQRIEIVPNIKFHPIHGNKLDLFFFA